jgi:hypothetical protein
MVGFGRSDIVANSQASSPVSLILMHREKLPVSSGSAMPSTFLL